MVLISMQMVGEAYGIDTGFRPLAGIMVLIGRTQKNQSQTE